MSQPVDVFITESELAEGRKAKRTTCLKIDQQTLRPVHCVSRPGLSTGTLFNRSEPQRTGRYLTDKEMASMYDKFVGASSLNNAAVRLEHEEREATSLQPSPSCSTAASSRASRAPYFDSGDRAPPPPSASVAVAMAAAGCDVPSQVHPDDQARERAAAAAAMKYVAPKIAKKYGITQSITPAGPRAAAAAAAARGPAGGARGAAASGRGGGGRGGASGAAADRPQADDSTSSLASSSGGDGRPPRPRSAAFNTTSREQARRAGSHFVWGGHSDVPPPGKYNPKYSATDKDQHAPLLGAAPAAAAAAAGSRARRPSSAPTHRTPDNADTGPSPAPNHDAQAAAAAQPPGASSSAARRSLGHRHSSQSAAAAAGGGGGGGSGGGVTGLLRLTSEARSQLHQRHEELFGAAHKVHPRRPEGPPGSSSFKAAQRKPLYETGGPAAQLFGEYFKEGYDSLIRKPPRPSSAFHTQSQRQYSPLGETSPGVGPGSYGQNLPGTNTGRHVPAGHPGLSRTPDWSRTTPRPTSAPPARPPPASALHQGYWGPDGPTTSLFPDDPDYSELNGVRMLQERTPLRPTSAVPSRKPSQQQQQQQQQWHAPAAAAAAVGTAAGAPGSAATAAAAAAAQGCGDGRPLVYVGPERYGELTSAGLAKRVPGGAFGTATRQGTCQGMRAIANPHVTPPAAVLVKPATDLSYDYDYAVEGHRGRQPAWHLPLNRNALSQQWIEASAATYMPYLS
ncbi:hypothetical protein PLESTB_001700300 [Pleodorina starrii]|uniref:Uncharacterized protein n=1 Tax=Pleodorina starrii TaxID=330485 RepID=A0A9W6F9T7_9CHLO|nr:hypothetical protein PLESTB_001700300 [Pleodorina starrii]GLC76742.1 hypothetical protein PLESTF_001825600 [Pleodorina starrii]